MSLKDSKEKSYKNLYRKLNMHQRYFIDLIGSKKFLWFAIGVFFIQALWMAVSIRYPMLFDEMYHFGVIKIFGKQLSPIILNQPSQYDNFGSLTYGNASIYHYIFSFPYRIISSITDSLAAQVISLRILNITLATIGLWVYALLFREINIKQIYINLTILFFSLIPIVIFVAATISYDNLLFPLTAWFLLIGVKLIKSKDFNLTEIIKYLLVGTFAAVIKFTFLPLLTIGIVYVGYVYVRRYGRSIYSYSVGSFLKISFVTKVILIAMMLVTFGLFAARYLTAIAIYHSPIPACSIVLGNDRCMSGNVYVYEKTAQESKNDRSAESIEQYLQTWKKTILLQLDTSAAVTSDGLEVGKAMPIFAGLMTLAVYMGGVALLLAWSRIKKDNSWVFLITMSGFLIITIFIFNAQSYYSANQDLNTQIRYLLSIMPIFIAMSLVAISTLLGNKRHIKVILLFVVLILSTQGGGIIKPIINANDGWYWDSPVLQKTNEKLKNSISPLVSE